MRQADVHPSSLPPHAALYRALTRRDAAFDGLFWAGVRTTGIVCRTVCPARSPLAKNVVFFGDLGAATSAGYRPCMRCKPDQQPRPADALAARWIATPLGGMLAVASGAGVCLLEFADRAMLGTQLGRIRARFGVGVAMGPSRHFDVLERELAEYFAGTRRAFTTKLAPRGTPFQEAAWEQLKAIPYGATRSYEQQAAAIGRPRAQRAIGKANGDNRLAIVLPCHRVVRADGSLSGYGGGVWRKRRLLELEGAVSAL